jgi:hypothetical protein
MTRRCILLFPEYFDGRLDGIGRVSEMADRIALASRKAIG